MNFFKVHHRSSKSKARLGTISTAHGEIQTPSFVPVATKATLKGLTPQLARDLELQVQFVNTYHLVVHPGADLLEKAGGAHKFSNLPTPLMSDSGGFQVFSLANSSRRAKIHGEEEPFVQKITEDGVIFRSTYDGSLIEFTPELSMKYQQQIGADMFMAFDECTYYPATKKYAIKAMDRTHEWLKRCIEYINESTKSKILHLKQIQNSKNINLKQETQNDQFGTSNFELSISSHGYPQYLYGIIQGGTYEDLRKKSAEFVCSQPTPGIAVGGISVGETKAEMREQVGWVSDYLPADRPVHMLGIGGFDDIMDLMKYGGDTFDCVEPTRAARMGLLYQSSAVVHAQHLPTAIVNKVSEKPFQLIESPLELDITKLQYRHDLTPIDENCECYVCTNFTKAYIHHLFKQRELLAYTLASFHNLFIMEKYMKVLREMVAQDLI